MLRNMLCIAMAKKVDNLIYEFDNLQRGFQILRDNIIEKEVPALGHASCSVSDFHSLMTSFQALLENTCEKDFINYVRNEDDVRTKYIEMSNESEGLKAAYQTASQHILELDSKLKQTTHERDALLGLFEDLKEMLFDGSFRKLSTDTKQKLTSMVDSFQKASTSSLPSHRHLRDAPSNNVETEFSTETNRSLVPYVNNTSNVDYHKTEIFLPEPSKAPSPKFLVPDSDDVHDVDSSSSDSDKVKVTGEVQVITVTWDEMKDKSSDAVKKPIINQSPDLDNDIDAMDSIDIHDSSSDVEDTNDCIDLTSSPEYHQIDDDEIALKASIPRPRKSLFPVFKCDNCDIGYCRRDNLLRHRRICSGTFTPSPQLKKQKMASQSNPKQHTCPICHRSFSRKDYRDRHLKSHGTKETYTCAYCNKNYTSKQNLSLHITSRTCLKS